MALILPKILKLIFENNGNEIWQYFGNELSLENIQILSINPFVIEYAGISYFLTNNHADQNIEDYEYALIVSKKPTRGDIS